MSRRSGFPSWTWAGWLFEENNNAIYPLDIRGPCPGSIIFFCDGEMTYWSSDCVNSPFIGIREWHDSLLYPDDSMIAKEWDKIVQENVEDVINRPDGTPLSSLIFFWTSTVLIQTRKEDENQNSILKGATILSYRRKKVVMVRALGERLFQSIVARPEPSWIGFAYTESVGVGEFFLILIRWTDGIARRIFPHLLFTVSAQEWEEAHPQHNLIILG